MTVRKLLTESLIKGKIQQNCLNVAVSEYFLCYCRHGHRVARSGASKKRVRRYGMAGDIPDEPCAGRAVWRAPRPAAKTPYRSRANPRGDPAGGIGGARQVAPPPCEN